MDEACWTAADRERVITEVAGELWRYVSARARPVELASRLLADVSGLGPTDLEVLRYLHVLLSGEVTRFVAQALPALLQRPRPAAPLHLAGSRSQVRGRIEWGATLAARARSGAADPTLYLSRLPRTTFDSAETRLLVALLHGLRDCCACLRPLAPAMAPGSWTEHRAGMEDAVERALAHPALRGIAPDSAAFGADLAACRRSRRAAVRALAQTGDLYRELVVERAPAALFEAFKARALLPLDDDVLYELWALLRTIAAFREAGWTPLWSGLVGQSGAPARFRAPGGHIIARIYAGHTPAAWRRASRYRTLFTQYGLAGATRRPDIVVELRAGSRRRYLLIEVKRTVDAGYIADSVYKVLGYLADFEPVFEGARGTRAVLLIWEGVREVQEVPRADALIVSTHQDYADLLKVLIAAISLDAGLPGD